MFTREIRCQSCGKQGKIEAHDTVEVVPKTELFQVLGKDPSTGFMYFRCPSCSLDLAVDPFKVIGASEILAFPSTSASAIESRPVVRSNRHVPIIWGVVCIAISILIFVKFQGSWKYVVCGLLLMLGWGSLKFGLSASNKEISEMTEQGPVSDETKSKFINKL